MSTWHASAPCASTDPDAFFPDEKEQAAPAKRICARCPYRAPCVTEAIERGEQYGIWGGLSTRQFRKVRRELREVAA